MSKGTQTKMLPVSVRRACEGSDQPKIEGIENNDARRILRGKLNGTTT